MDEPEAYPAFPAFGEEGAAVAGGTTRIGVDSESPEARES